jgi:hypothetical protein
MKNVRHLRLEDFEERSQLSAAHAIDGLGRYIPIHPLADEAELLAQLQMAPQDCLKVDLYWHIDGDVLFVQINTASSDPFRPPGLYARMSTSGYVNVAVVTEETMVSSALVEATLRKLKSSNIDPKALGETLAPL